MTTPCTARASCAGSLTEALYRAFDIDSLFNELVKYYLWRYSRRYVLRQSLPISAPGEYTTRTKPMALPNILVVLEAYVKVARDSCWNTKIVWDDDRKGIEGPEQEN